MSNYFINNSRNLNISFKGPSYSSNNIFNAQNYRNTGNIYNNLNYPQNQNISYLPKNNSSYFYINNNNYINNVNNYLNNTNYNNNNNYNNNLILNQNYTTANQTPIQNINSTNNINNANYYYQNNIPPNTWNKNDNIYYTPTNLTNTKNTILYSYTNLKFNNSYQNLTNRTNNSNLNPNSINNKNNNYNINSNNSASTNTKSNYSNNNNKNNNMIKNTSNPELSKKNISRIKKFKTTKNKLSINSKKQEIINQIYSSDPKEPIDPAEFKIIKRIGEGSYGKIYEVQWIRNEKKYAMKKEPIKTNEIVNKSKEKIRLMNDFITKTNCPGIVKIYGNSVKKEKDHQEYYYYILMELAEKDWDQEIAQRKKYNIYYTEKELFIIMSQLISTLSLLQKNHITHRDIKPKNILLINGSFKLSDFGEARTLKRTGIIISRVRGTELFMSPILFHGFKHRLSQVGHNTFKSDVFSLGLCFLLAASLTFNTLYSIREVNDIKLIEECLDKYLSERYTVKITNIILDMLQLDENLRPDFINLEKKYFLKK